MEKYQYRNKDHFHKSGRDYSRQQNRDIARDIEQQAMSAFNTTRKKYAGALSALAHYENIGE